MPFWYVHVCTCSKDVFTRALEIGSRGVINPAGFQILKTAGEMSGLMLKMYNQTIEAGALEKILSKNLCYLFVCLCKSY